MSGWYMCVKVSATPSVVSRCHVPIPIVRNSLIGAALSFGLLFSFPSVSAVQPPSQKCRETLQTAPEVVTNQGLVEEAWQIVNDTFLDTGRHHWSRDTWQLKKEALLSTPIQTRSKAHQIIKRMLSSLADPYTRFLSPDEFSKMARYDMTGVGINLKEVPDENGDLRLEVLGIILDGPAHSAGVRQGDEILAVNNMEVKGKSAFEVSSLLQGPNGTSVTIQVKHGNCGPVESIEVQRQIVARTPVFYRLEQLDNGATPVGYIRLKEFNALARKDLVIAMKRLQDMGAQYFMLDLRDNLGGLVQAGIEIAKLFLNEGDTVIYTAGRDSQLQKAIVTDTSPLIQAPVVVIFFLRLKLLIFELAPWNYFYFSISFFFYHWGRNNSKTSDFPINFFKSFFISGHYISLISVEFSVCGLHDKAYDSFWFETLQILVNDKTASASEIVASALHDNCRAVLVGKRTYGKGLIQSVFELDDGSGVVITVGKYVTPNHKDINGNGIEPDFQKLPAWDDISQHLKKCSMPQQG